MRYPLIILLLLFSCAKEKKVKPQENKDSVFEQPKPSPLPVKESKVKAISYTNVKKYAVESETQIYNNTVSELVRYSPGIPNQFKYVDPDIPVDFPLEELSYSVSWINLTQGPVTLTIPNSSLFFFMMYVTDLNGNILFENMSPSKGSTIVFASEKPVNLPEGGVWVKATQDFYYMEIATTHAKLRDKFLIQGQNSIKKVEPNTKLPTQNEFYEISIQNYRKKDYDSVTQKHMDKLYKEFVANYKKTYSRMRNRNQFGGQIKNAKKDASWTQGNMSQYSSSQVRLFRSELIKDYKSAELFFDIDSLPTTRKSGLWVLSLYDEKGKPLGNHKIKSYDNYNFNSDGSISFVFSEKRPKFVSKLNWINSESQNFYVLLRVYKPSEIHTPQLTVKTKNK